jgi:hypothetical protein
VEVKEQREFGARMTRALYERTLKSGCGLDDEDVWIQCNVMKEMSQALLGEMLPQGVDDGGHVSVSLFRFREGDVKPTVIGQVFGEFWRHGRGEHEYLSEDLQRVGI